MRKVGPALRRVSEKVDEAWLRKWINSPRGFRPDTRMPHFYNLSNNHPDVLPADPNNKDYNQKDYPSAEIASIAHYLFTESTRYVNHGDTYLRLQMDREKELLDLQAKNQISDKQRLELIEVQRRIELAGDPRKEKRIRVADTILDADRRPIPKDQVPQPGTDKDREEGRRLFTERGCLACHSHSGTERAAGSVAAVNGEATFGPNLSRLAAKLNRENGRRWLIQWILNPNVHFPRTRMPITHLTPKEAGQVADWLLDQPVPKDEAFEEWNKGVPEPAKEALVDLARVYLKKAPNVNPLEVDDVLANGFSQDRLTDPQNPQRIAPEADEQVLKGPIDNDKLKYYIGKKAVSRLGCFGCHDIPGFEFAKPIGTPLNDWGKKDPARLAFEDISAYVRDHYEVAELRDDPKDQAKPAESWAKVVTEGKKPYEKFFADALNAHLREGFLHQKLAEPRSYDYNRDVKWDDRLRMPQFKFSHPRQEKEEGDEDFKVRAAKEEAEAREAVMTFILGLVAEPIHPRYQYSPDPDRLAEVKGRQVIDKFNCAGCHLVRPGVYEFKANDDMRRLLGFNHETVARGLSTDYGQYFAAHNAWGAPPPASPDKLRLRAVRPTTRKPSPREAEQAELDADRDLLNVRLADALSFVDSAGQVKVFPAGVNVGLLQDQLTSRSDPFGGRFGDLMVPYLGHRGGDYQLKDGDNNFARRDLPPPLFREGERVQPEWLFKFLREPTPIRPNVILRMPKFNMSEDEARAIVNYFGAADKLNNPGIGLAYPYMKVPETDEAYWKDQARRYWERTGREKGLQERLKKLQDEELPAAKKKLADAKTDVEKKDAERGEAVVNAQIKALQDFAKDQGAAAEALYWHDAYKLIATPGKSICLDCHSVGAVKAAKEQGPPLDLAFARLRPGWTKYWMGNPDRLLTYPSVMPQNLPNGQSMFQELMPVSSLEQVEAVRDILMNLPKAADMPVNRSYRAATTGGK
jgi:cbb3-type cytochrome oxidase cytochrome c subunit